ncbi:MAG: PEP-CTERM sorting domain-containing protein [Pseudomonadota bacterium]
MTKLTKIAAAVTAVTLAGAAHGGVITSTISLDQLLNAPNGVYSGNFSLNPLLAANGLAGGTILSANISAYGFSDTQLNRSGYAGYSEGYNYGYSNNIVVSTYSYSYSCGWGWSTCFATGYNYGYAAYNDFNATYYYENVDSVLDTMKLSAGTGNTTGSDSRSVSSYNSNFYSYSRSNGTYGYDSVHVHDQVTTDVTSGDLSSSYTFGSAELLAMALSGQLDFSVSAVSGQFDLRQVSISLDVLEAAVPEPASAALLLAGLAGLAAATRARRAKKPS